MESLPRQDNEYEAKEFGAKDVFFSKPCGISIEEMVKSPWGFQKLRNFRAGIEGVISYLKRCFGLGKAMWKRAEGSAAFASSGIAAYNLTILSKLI